MILQKQFLSLILTKYIPLLVLFFCFTTFSSAQTNEKQDHYLVEFEKFTPPTKDLIKSFENFPAEAFLAPDINGNEHFSGNYKGKYLILWFWSIQDEVSLQQLSLLNDLADNHKSKLNIISFAEEEKSDVLDFAKTTPVSFPIIFKSKVFGDFAYGGDLGNGRIFVIDDFGIIKKVYPREIFENSIHRAELINNLLSEK